ncbi:MAG: Gfo/Idh/MocA family oxidoreductase [Planctomycetota bacterium]
MPIRIGFIDDSCDNYHANTFLALLRGELSSCGTVVGVHALTAESGRAWAASKGLPWYDDAAALARQCDALMVLAPSTPETHPELAKRALPAGLPTYIDKTFATDLAAAKAIFALADTHRAPLQSSSVLRWTSAHRALAASGEMKNVRHVSAWGGGRSFAEYAIHPLEVVVSLLGPEVRRVLRLGSADFSQLLMEFSDHRQAVVTVACGTDTAMAVSVTTATATLWPALDNSTLFKDALQEICAFLADGTPRIDRRETLAIRAVLDAANDPRCLANFMQVPWV